MKPVAGIKPDILDCLANLSSDEVFTPPKVVNAMLDMLPPELFTNPKTKFLDPFTKSGVFLREIAKRLDKGLAEAIPDKDARIRHVFAHQVYGIAITQLTALFSRRSLYCNKDVNNVRSAIRGIFKTPDGNIGYHSCKHTWKNGSCTICGASKKALGESAEVENYAYPFLHDETFMKQAQELGFDVVIGNPPYQIKDGGGTGDAAMPIYNDFVIQAKRLNPQYLVMIIPSRWMKGGRGLGSFRDQMMHDRHLKIMVDYEDEHDCFPGVNIDGGVCYFLWHRKYNGKVRYTYKPRDENPYTIDRFLDNGMTDVVIRDSRQLSIISKAQAVEEERFDQLVSTQKPFGIRADFFNSPDRYAIRQYADKTDCANVCVYGVKGKKGGARRVTCYIRRQDVPDLEGEIDSYKLFFSKAYMTKSTVPPEIIIGDKNSICTETFLLIGGFETKAEQANCLSYIKTKFFRALLFYKRHSLNISKESFSLIPLQDFSKPWTDAELYKKYNLTKEEIMFIESMIKPME